MTIIKLQGRPWGLSEERICLQCGRPRFNLTVLAWRIHSMDTEVWWATVHRVTESWTWLKQLSTHADYMTWFLRVFSFLNDNIKPEEKNYKTFSWAECIQNYYILWSNGIKYQFYPWCCNLGWGIFNNPVWLFPHL